jgi:hypothetical protein
MDTFIVLTTLALIGIGFWQVHIMKGQQATAQTEGIVSAVPWYRKYWPIMVMFLILVLNWIPYFLRQPEFKVLPHNKLELVEGQHFFNESIEMDGKLFRQCDFTNVTLVFRGRANVEFEYAHFFQPLIIKTGDVPAKEFGAFVVNLERLGNFVDSQKVGFDSSGDIILLGGTGGEGNFGVKPHPVP